MLPTVIYIMCPGHSGSTFLQYLLATQTNLLGIGEVDQLAAGRGWDDSNLFCSCGAPFSQCELWSGMKPISGESQIEWYRRLTLSFKDKHPEVTHWIDSSKRLKSIQPWLQLLREGLIKDIRIFFLVRDVRGWALSDQRDRKRKNQPMRPLIMSVLSWWRKQHRILNQLETMDLKYQVVSYEGLIFQTEKAESRMACFLGINPDDHSWANQLERAVVHDAFGNRMKNDPKSRSRIIYDNSWQYCPGLNLLASALIPVWRLNAKLYRDGTT